MSWDYMFVYTPYHVIIYSFVHPIIEYYVRLCIILLWNNIFVCETELSEWNESPLSSIKKIIEFSRFCEI